MLPVAGSKVSTGGTVEPAATLIVTVAVVTATPFSVSPGSTLSTSLPPVAPLIPPTLSLTATIGAATTVTVAVAVAQLAGFSRSQMV